MVHIAILKPSFGFLPKILSGEKTIESRWHASQSAPWGKVLKGDIVYFKNSGKHVEAVASVADVMEIQDLSPMKVRMLLYEFGTQIGLNDPDLYFKTVRDKKYCILVFLSEPKRIKPFSIDKRGFGMQAAWLSIKSLKNILLKP